MAFPPPHPIKKLGPAPSKQALAQPGFSFAAGPARQYGSSSSTPYVGAYGAAAPGYGMKKRYKDDGEYFDDDEDEDPAASGLDYQPSADSPTHKGAADDSDSDDPLEAFMAGVQDQIVTDNAMSDKKRKGKKGAKEKDNVREDIEAEDEMEAYMRYMEENPNAGIVPEDEVIDYDDDGNPLYPMQANKKIIDPLPSIDHGDIDYNRFEKNFYEEHAEIAALASTDVTALQRKLGIWMSGMLPLKPVSSFAHFGFDDKLLGAIRKANYSTPTPIQATAVPTLLSGRDVIGVARTGSGKTAAFVWPLLVHIMDQPELKPGDGPIGLICAPTRELAQQIYTEVKKFGRVYNINVVCAYGGGNMYEQSKACGEGAEIIVCTPGRLIDLVKKKATNLRRVTYLVLDEADRMFNLGFEPQVRSIANHVRPDRQTMLFSATFKWRIEKLARDILKDPIKIVQGDIGEANSDITQVVEIYRDQTQKWNWLLRNLVQFTTLGSVLIFVTRKLNSEEVANSLKLKDFKVRLLHGDMAQITRNEIISEFKKNAFPILVATDVAARGLDIPAIKTVVNYDVARDIDTHTHRIGRTGRAGQTGNAFTLVTPKDFEFAAHLVRNLEGANQVVPSALLDLAMKNDWFKKTRFKHGKAKRLNTGGGQGLGFRERPGFGTDNETSAPVAGSSRSGSSKSKAYEPPVPQESAHTSRLNTLRQAFSSQFRGHFVASEDSSSTQTIAMERQAQQITAVAAAEAASAATASAAQRSRGRGGYMAAPGMGYDADKGSRKRKQRWDV